MTEVGGSEPAHSGFDVIGDIHGHADALRRLLTKLGYGERDDGAFTHPRRTVIFLGDFIDRGPQQREALDVVRRMCAAGTAQAVMGNHEFNAIGWSIPDGWGDYLRPHNEKNAHQHAAFLREFPEGSPAYKEAIGWFRELPVWIELAGLRIVHACWHEASQTALRPFLDGSNRLLRSRIEEMFCKGSRAYGPAEILLKGPEENLPEGLYFHDKDGFCRTNVRLRWWDREATTYRKAALGFEGRVEELPDLPLPCDYRCDEALPVFFGHYWLAGAPTLTGSTAACLDFSVAKGGYLTCYRWSGERQLRADHLVGVPATE